MHQNAESEDAKTRSLERSAALKNQYKAEILNAKQDSWKEFCTENARSSPWKMYKRCKAATQVTQPPPR